LLLQALLELLLERGQCRLNHALQLQVNHVEVSGAMRVETNLNKSGMSIFFKYISRKTIKSMQTIIKDNDSNSENKIIIITVPSIPRIDGQLRT
jgi:hypothetical protein